MIMDLLEAGTGIEPVFTDLQSNSLSRENNALSHKKYHDKPGTTGERDTAARKSTATISKYMKPAHLRLSRVLGYALTLGDAEGWRGFAIVAEARLSVLERGALAFAALNSLPRDCAETVAAANLGAAGAPLPAFLGGMSDARTWAEWATPKERKAYALAAFEAMTPHEQAAFLNHISTAKAAA